MAHFDWMVRPGNLIDATLHVVDQHRSAPAPAMLDQVAIRGMYPYWLDDLFEAGFTDLESFSFDSPARYTHESWRGRMRASAWIGATLEKTRVADFDRALASALRDRFADPIEVPHRVFVAYGRKA